MRIDARQPRPKQPATLPKAAFSVPGQNPVSDTTVAPWRMVCAIEIDLPGVGIAAGTGWLLGDRMVVTAGHVLEDAAVAQIRVFPAASGGRAGQPLHATSFLTGKDGDYAAVFLTEEPGASFGTFGIVDPAIAINGDEVVLAGYDPDDGGRTLWTGAGPARELSPERLRYDIATVRGQSGGPVWLQSDNTRLVGLHVGRFSGFNQAQRLTQAICDQLLQWREDSERGVFAAASRVALNWRTFAPGRRTARRDRAPRSTDLPFRFASNRPPLAIDRVEQILRAPSAQPRSLSNEAPRSSGAPARCPPSSMIESSLPARADDTVIVKLRPDVSRQPMTPGARSMSSFIGVPPQPLLETLVVRARLCDEGHGGFRRSGATGRTRGLDGRRSRHPGPTC